MGKNAYTILGLDPDANVDQVDGAFKRLAKALHPDVNKRSTAEQEFKDLNWAKSTLLDDMLRKEHDYGLMKVAAAAEPRDFVDEVLDGERPKKKKKRKKKRTEAGEQGQNYQPPPMPPNHFQQYEGRGRGDFESIPPGYDHRDDLGGIL